MHRHIRMHRHMHMHIHIRRVLPWPQGYSLPRVTVHITIDWQTPAHYADTFVTPRVQSVDTFVTPIVGVFGRYEQLVVHYTGEAVPSTRSVPAQ